MLLDQLIANPHERMVAWLFVTLAAGIGAILDARSHRLPNDLTLPLWIAGVIFSGAVGGLTGLGEALAASVLLAIPYVLLFAFAGGGAGDAKLMAAIGAWLGLAHGAYALVGVVVMGALAGVAVSLVRGEIARVARNLSTASTGLIAVACGQIRVGDSHAVMPPTSEMRRMPYGIAVLLGVLTAFGGGLLWHAH